MIAIVLAVGALGFIGNLIETGKVLESFYGAIVAMFGISIFGTIYLLPYLIAFEKRKRNLTAILFLDIFAGWTVIGWIAAMTWALMEDK